MGQREVGSGGGGMAFQIEVPSNGKHMQQTLAGPQLIWGADRNMIRQEASEQQNSLRRGED